MYAIYALCKSRYTCIFENMVYFGIYQASLSIGFFRQEYWSGFSCPPPGDLPNQEIKPASLMCPALAGGFFITCATWEACCCITGQ